MKRKQTQDKLRRIENIIQMIKTMDGDSIDLFGQRKHQNTLSQFASIAQKITDQIKTLPIGHRYTGTFFLKIPYTLPAEYKKIDGSIFMREHQVSWEVEDGKGFQNQCYYRFIYKTASDDHNQLITRDDAEPVFTYKKPVEETV